MSCMNKIRTESAARNTYRNARDACVARGWTKAGFNARMKVIAEGTIEDDQAAGLSIREDSIYAHVARCAERGNFDHMKA